MIENKFVGFVSRKTTFKDNDAIINVITKDGVKTFKARGILKITSKNANSCNYFMLSEFVTYSKKENSNETLKSANCLKIYKKPFDDLLISSCYLYICNVLDKLSKEINGYDLTLKCFEDLEKGIYPINVVNYFLKNLIETMGYNPNLEGCINCLKKDNLISFSFESGGFICNSCFDSTRYEKLPTNYLKSLYNFLKEKDMVELEELQANRLFKSYNQFLNEELGLYVEEFDFILKCI